MEKKEALKLLLNGTKLASDEVDCKYVYWKDNDLFNDKDEKIKVDFRKYEWKIYQGD